MYPFSIGVMLDSFRTDMLTALDKAAALGAKGIQVYATRGEMSPEKLYGEKRKEFLKAVKDHGLTVSALCGDLGKGFVNPELNPGFIICDCRLFYKGSAEFPICKKPRKAKKPSAAPAGQTELPALWYPT